jgi:hypothetical protein
MSTLLRAIIEESVIPELISHHNHDDDAASRPCASGQRPAGPPSRNASTSGSIERTSPRAAGLRL